MRKKLLLFLFVLLGIFSPNIIEAKENRLYFSSKDNKLYYDSALFDSSIFMHHLDLVPGNENRDLLLIENGSKQEYALYLKVKERDQNSDANYLLDHILMKVYLDDVLIYDGKVKGKDYNNDGVNLQDSVFIGNYPKGKTSELLVVTMLDPDYSLEENLELSYIDWEFYANYEDNTEIINPSTFDPIDQYVIIFMISFIGIIVSIFLFKRKKMS